MSERNIKDDFSDFFKKVEQQDQDRHDRLFSIEAQIQQQIWNLAIDEEDEHYNFIVQLLKMVAINEKAREEVLKLELRQIDNPEY